MAEPTREEREEQARRDQAEAMLAAIHAQRAAEDEKRRALSEAIQEGLRLRDEERRQREEEGR
jgi:hypothetical protein